MDKILEEIAEYVDSYEIESQEAYDTACLCLLDSLGCAALALQYEACTKLLGPIIPKTTVPNGSRVPATSWRLDPIRAAFNIGTMIRWLDYNDTWLAAEWGHPSDNLGALLAVADYCKDVTVRDLLTAMIKAYEIQGILALENSFNRIGLDHVILVKVASAAVSVKLLGGKKKQIANALTQAWMDIGPLRAYRHAPNTGSRKSWAAGDATSRGLQLAWMTMQGEMGYPQVLGAPHWGLQDVLFKGKPLTLARPLGSYVMENILFKVSFPAEFHAQTAVECAFQLHPEVCFEGISHVLIQTQKPAVRIIDKKGPLKNPADRDHCLQYMVAIGLLFGELTADHYEDDIASDPRIDTLREKMVVEENLSFSKDYLDPSKRSIANAITLHFKDGTTSDTIICEYPIGHRQRRQEAIPKIYDKAKQNLSIHFPKEKVDELLALLKDKENFLPMLASNFIGKMAVDCSTRNVCHK